MPTVKLSINKNYSSLEIFLKKHRATPGGSFTHTSITAPPASYYIGKSEQDNFMEKY